MALSTWLNRMALPFVFICLCGSFSDDHVYKTWPILTSSKNGRKSLAIPLSKLFRRAIPALALPLGLLLVLVSLLVGVVMIFGWNLLTLYGAGDYYAYDAQQDSAERLARPYGEVEVIRRDYMRGLSGQVLDEPFMEQLKAGYGDSDTGTIQWNRNSSSPFHCLNAMLSRSGVTAMGFDRSEVRDFWVNPEEEHLTEEEMDYWKGQASGLKPFRLDYAGGWQRMAQDCNLLCQVAVLLSAVCLCRLFAEEHRTRTDQLVLASARGKTTAFWARRFAGVSFAAGLSLFFFHGVCRHLLWGLRPGRIFHRPPAVERGTSPAFHLSMGGYVLVLLSLLAFCGYCDIILVVHSDCLPC